MRVLTARKEHTCAYCDGTIERHELYRHSVQHRSRWHSDCPPVLAKVDGVTIVLGHYPSRIMDTFGLKGRMAKVKGQKVHCGPGYGDVCWQVGRGAPGYDVTIVWSGRWPFRQAPSIWRFTD